MANLRELRKTAMDLGISYEKDTTKEELEEMIIAKQLDVADDPTATVDTSPVEETPAPVAAPPESPALLTVTSVEDIPAEPPLSTFIISKDTPSQLLPIEEVPEDPTPKPVRRPVKNPGIGSFADSMSINDSDLNAEFIRQAALFERAATLDAKAQAVYLDAKFQADIIEAEASKKFRLKYQTDGVKATEKQIDSDVLLDEPCKEARKKVIIAKERADIARGAKDALVHKKDMLIQLGSTARSNREQNISILHEKAKAAMTA